MYRSSSSYLCQCTVSRPPTSPPLDLTQVLRNKSWPPITSKSHQQVEKADQNLMVFRAVVGNLMTLIINNSTWPKPHFNLEIKHFFTKINLRYCCWCTHSWAFLDTNDNYVDLEISRPARSTMLLQDTKIRSFNRFADDGQIGFSLMNFFKKNSTFGTISL